MHSRIHIVRRGLQECWKVGSQLKAGGTPDIVLEVIYASPILNKLHVYDGFGVPEGWPWKDGAFEIYVLDVKRKTPTPKTGRYVMRQRSTFLPSLDFALLSKYVAREDQDVAVREFANEIKPSQATPKKAAVAPKSKKSASKTKRRPPRR